MPCRLDPPPPLPQPATALPAALGWIDSALDQLDADGLRRQIRIRSGRQGREVELDGRRLLNFGSNDYLGLAGDVRLTRACSKGSCAEGFGAGASPLVSGQSQAHRSLERGIATLLAVDAALTFPSGFAANAATIPAVVGDGDLIASDARNHASIIDGCRLSKARLIVYPHRDVAALEAMLTTAGPARRILIVTDSLFSMDGTIAPLADLCDVAARHAAMLMVDEAHATGVFGERGSGLVEASGCSDGVHIRVGTLSKALGTAGGFVAGHASLVSWLAHAARGWVFSTAHPPGVAAAATRAVELLAEEPFRRRELLAKAATFREQIAAAGQATHRRIASDLTSQILPVIVGEPGRAVAAAERLLDAGFFVPAIRPPSVPDGASLLRISLAWHHTDDDLVRLADTLQTVLA
jgi:8-amino-7-oxononanoate synthase